MNLFVRGLLSGSGFAVGLVLVGSLSLCGVSKLSRLRKFDDSSSISSLRGDHSVIGKEMLSIKEHRVSDRSVLGSVKNNTNKPLFSVIVEVSLFDKTGKFLDKNTEYLSIVPPNETIGFKVEFFPRSLSDVTAKVRITQGFDEQQM